MFIQQFERFDRTHADAAYESRLGRAPNDVRYPKDYYYALTHIIA